MFTTLFLVCILPFLLVASGFFSGTETALFSLTQQQRRELRRKPNFAARTVNELLGETRTLLITLLMGNMTINVLFFVISSLIAIRLEKVHAASGVVIASAAIAPLLLIILLGEVLPKLVAARLTVAWAKTFALPLWVVHRVLGPIRWAVNQFVISPLARLAEPTTRPAALSSSELENLLKLSQKQGVIDADEEQLLLQVLELGQVRVTELMTPRVDVGAFDLTDAPGGLVEMAKDANFSRIPVYTDSLDQIEGVVFARQVLLRRPATRQAVRALLRDVKYVPAQMKADRLLIDMRRTGSVFAVVVDEYGGTAGVVTLEDVVEHMVGDIIAGDEHEADAEIEQITDGQWHASAQLSVRDWPEAFDQAVPIHGVQTLGGLIMSLLGRVAKQGDEVQVGNLTLTVERTQRTRIDRVRITRTETGGEA